MPWQFAEVVLHHSLRGFGCFFYPIPFMGNLWEMEYMDFEGVLFMTLQILKIAVSLPSVSHFLDVETALLCIFNTEIRINSS